MKNCEGCPLYDAAQCEIRGIDSDEQALVNRLAARAAVPEATVEIVGGDGVAPGDDQRESGREQMLQALAGRPKLQKAYTSNLARYDAARQEQTERIETAQRTCSGPEQRRVFKLFGRAALVCSTKARIPSLMRRYGL